MAGFEKRHRSHPEARDAACSGVSDEVIGRYGRPCENELPGVARVVDRPSDMVPDIRFNLPLVDQTRSVSVQNEGGIDPYGASGSDIDIEEDLTSCSLPCCCRFARRFWALDENNSAGR